MGPALRSWLWMGLDLPLQLQFGIGLPWRWVWDWPAVEVARFTRPVANDPNGIGAAELGEGVLVSIL